MKLNRIFFTPVWTDVLSELTDAELADVFAHCIKLQDSTSGVQFSNKGGFQSTHYELDDFKGTVLYKVLNSILSKLNGCMLEQIGSLSKLRFQKIWININNEADYNITHNHGGVLSGAFYVNTPQPVAPIFFSNQYAMSNWFYGEISSNHNTEVTTTEMKFFPKEKMLVVFPSWLYHGVNPSESTEPRISIAFNTEIDK